MVFFFFSNFRTQNKDGGRLLSDELPKRDFEGKVSRDSDDELLSSVLKYVSLCLTLFEQTNVECALLLNMVNSL